MQVSTMTIDYMIILLAVYISPALFVGEIDCICGSYEQYPWVGPYCYNWIQEGPTFCFLHGWANASSCPDAFQLGNASLYWTNNDEICEKSYTSYTLQNCKCGFYPDYDFVGPYCAEWIEEDPPFCFLASGHDSRYCPGAVQWGDENLYWTEDKDICKKSQNYTLQHCKCSHYPEYPNIGPYCAK